LLGGEAIRTALTNRPSQAALAAMENYKISKKLGKGAQGSVFLCKDTRDGKEYVLKKVECNDESEANKAFKEAMALEQLSHKYICGYKEFFVNWDKQEETMYVPATAAAAAAAGVLR